MVNCLIIEEMQSGRPRRAMRIRFNVQSYNFFGAFAIDKKSEWSNLRPLRFVNKI